MCVHVCVRVRARVCVCDFVSKKGWDHDEWRVFVTEVMGLYHQALYAWENLQTCYIKAQSCVGGHLEVCTVLMF